MKNKKKVLFLTQAAIIAAIYVVLVVIWPLSSSAIQVRLAESLTILPFLTPAAIPGVTLGCLISNLITGCDVLDIIFGSLATLIGATGSYLLRRNKYLVPLPPIIANTIMVPWILRIAYGLEDAVPYLMLTIGIGEVLSCGVLGLILLFVLNRYKGHIFGESKTI